MKGTEQKCTTATKDCPLAKDVEREGIDRIDVIVCKLVNALEMLNETYIQHINQVCLNRDKTYEHNAELLKMVSSLQAELSRERERYDKLVAYIAHHNGASANTTNINV